VDDARALVAMTMLLQVVQLANNLTSVTLSSLYMDMVKDRLYADPPTSPRRLSAQVRSRRISSQALRRLAIAVRMLLIVLCASTRCVQTVLLESLRQLCLCIAPIVPFTAEDVYQHSAAVVLPQLQSSEAVDLLATPAVPSTVFDVAWPTAPASWSQQDVATMWQHVLHLYSKVVPECSVPRGVNICSASSSIVSVGLTVVGVV
jgi:isoleucyl-tRNA synthetase